VAGHLFPTDVWFRRHVCVCGDCYQVNTRHLHTYTYTHTGQHTYKHRCPVPAPSPTTQKVMISHDSGFLDRVTTNIIHYEDNRKLRNYKGNLGMFVKRVPRAKTYYELSEENLSFSFPEPGLLDGVKSKYVLTSSILCQVLRMPSIPLSFFLICLSSKGVLTFSILRAHLNLTLPPSFTCLCLPVSLRVSKSRYELLILHTSMLPVFRIGA